MFQDDWLQSASKDFVWLAKGQGTPLPPITKALLFIKQQDVPKDRKGEWQE